MSPTARSLAELRKRGYIAAVVERWNPHARLRQDLFGCIDVLAIRPGQILAVQACAGSSAAARIAKVKSTPAFTTMLAAGITVAVWSWSKRGARGKRKVWTLREVVVDMEAP